jgi:class 3 adenylate cyclase
MYEQLDVRPLLGSIQAPTLVLRREDDRLIPRSLSDALATGIPDAEFVDLPGEDHLFLAGDSDAIVDRIEEFLTGRPPAPEPERILATVLFTDLVDSTETAAELGDRDWRSLLERFERASRRELDGYGGRLVKTTGDGLLATFDGPARAIRCARSMADRAEDLGVRIRAGVHTGEIEQRAGDVAGIAVHIASRVEGLAEPGEVTTTGTVADLVVGSGLRFRDAGARALKGVPGEWPIRVVVGDDGG